MFLIAIAVCFIAVLFFLKNNSVFTNALKKDSNGLTYKSETLENLINKDTDGDKVPDWEESLWGTDPTKKETTEGTPDEVAVNKLKTEQSASSGQEAFSLKGEESLTQTDKFSRELFSTVASLDQNGALDQETIDKLSTSLAEKVQNSAAKKIYELKDIKILDQNITLDIKNYAVTLGTIFKKHTITTSISDILSESMTSDGNIDVKVLNKLDPIIKEIGTIISEMKAIDVPSSFVALHLETLNGFELVMENLSDIKLVDSDPLLAISAVSQYGNNDATLKTSIEKLIAAFK